MHQLDGEVNIFFIQKKGEKWWDKSDGFESFDHISQQILWTTWLGLVIPCVDLDYWTWNWEFQENIRKPRMELIFLFHESIQHLNWWKIVRPTVVIGLANQGRRNFIKHKLTITQCIAYLIFICDFFLGAPCANQFGLFSNTYLLSFWINNKLFKKSNESKKN